MPTIDELTPATAASDTDEIMASQAGIARKVTRAQVLAGVQPALAIASGTLMGRCSAGTGAPETISVGTNLTLANGTLSAQAASFNVSQLPAGTVPASGDSVPLGQSGQSTAVTYGQFMGGLPGVANVDASQVLVTPTGASGSVKLADYAASTVRSSGGTMAGVLTLAADPAAPLQAATKNYVDNQVATLVPKVGGTMTGPLTLAADPISQLQAATKEYVDARLLRSGDTLTGPLMLAADPTSALQAATKEYVDTQVGTALPKSGGALTGTLTLASDPSASGQAATKHYVDTQVATALPLNGGTLAGSLMLAGDPAAATQAATKHYVDTQVATAVPLSGGAMTGALTLASDPAAASQAATKHYVDTQVATAVPLGGGTLTGALTLAADPVAASQAANKHYVDGQVATALPLGGGALTGTLTLQADPTSALQAATKQYVDAASGSGSTTGEINVKSAPYDAKFDGVTDDTAAFKAAYQAAPAGSVIFVPNGVTVMKNPSSWGIALTKLVKWAVDGTTLSDGTPLASSAPGGSPAANYLPGMAVGNSATSAEASRCGSQPTDFAVLHASYVVNHTGGTAGYVSCNHRNDTIIYGAPSNYIWGGLDRLLWCGTQTGSAATPAQHVGRYIQTIRQATTTGQPQPQLWAACLEYRDSTGQPSSATAAALTVEMDWYGNGADDANSRIIQSLVVGQSSTTGTPVQISTIIGVYLAAGSTGYAYSVFRVGIPFSSAVLDTTSAQQMTGAAAIKLAAGHAIAFEPTNSYHLAFDNTTNSLRWAAGSQSCVLGKGIAVGWETVCSGSTILSSSVAGNIVFLAGSGSAYTVTLPAASSMAAGTGFTFSVLGTAPATIAPAGSDSIDNGPVVLHQNDRYHIVADGSGAWREVLRTNLVNPHFAAPPVLPNYTVAALPTAPGTGAKAFATNGRKPGEAAAAGTGVEVFYDGTHWIAGCTGSQVLA